MCLIAIALNASPNFPLVIAANRDEDFTRPSETAHVWRDDPRIIGGRDRNHGGSWLAMSTTGRFAAVTNLRGAMTKCRSRGFLVSEFVAGDREVGAAAATVIARGAEYAGFHLVIGELSGQTFLLSNADGSVHEWPAGIHGVSNAPPGVPWPKVNHAIAAMQATLDRSSSRDDIVRDLLAFLAKPGDAAISRGSTLREEAESDVFVIGDRYGTRSSTVIVAGDGIATLAERTFRAGGVEDGEVRLQFSVPPATARQSGRARTS